MARYVGFLRQFVGEALNLRRSQRWLTFGSGGARVLVNGVKLDMEGPLVESTLSQKWQPVTLRPL